MRKETIITKSCLANICDSLQFIAEFKLMCAELVSDGT